MEGIDKQSTPGFRILPQDGQTRKRLYSWGMASGPWAMRRTAGVLVRTSSIHTVAQAGGQGVAQSLQCPRPRHLRTSRAIAPV